MTASSASGKHISARGFASVKDPRNFCSVYESAYSHNGLSMLACSGRIFCLDDVSAAQRNCPGAKLLDDEMSVFNTLGNKRWVSAEGIVAADFGGYRHVRPDINSPSAPSRVSDSVSQYLRQIHKSKDAIGGGRARAF
jgi:hypothetical protein